MAMAPNNPFENDSTDPFPGTPVQAKSSKSIWLWVLGIVTALGLLSVMACCGGGYWAINKTMQVLADDLSGKLIGNAVVEEHIGEIKSVSGDLGSTFTEIKAHAEAGEVGQPPLVFSIEGSNGSGKLQIRNDADGSPEEVKLVMEDGSEYPIDIGTPLLETGPDGVSELEEFSEIDIDLGESVETLPTAESQESDLP